MYVSKVKPVLELQIKFWRHLWIIMIILETEINGFFYNITYIENQKSYSTLNSHENFDLVQQLK